MNDQIYFISEFNFTTTTLTFNDKTKQKDIKSKKIMKATFNMKGW